MIRQGDVLLIPVKAIPAEAQELQPTERGLVLAEGEATGHAYVMEADVVSMWDVKGQRYVRVKGTTQLKHTHPSGAQADHFPMTVTPGDYEVRIQRDVWDGVCHPTHHLSRQPTNTHL